MGLAGGAGGASARGRINLEIRGRRLGGCRPESSTFAHRRGENASGVPSSAARPWAPGDGGASARGRINLEIRGRRLGGCHPESSTFAHRRGRDEGGRTRIATANQRAGALAPGPLRESPGARRRGAATRRAATTCKRDGSTRPYPPGTLPRAPNARLFKRGAHAPARQAQHDKLGEIGTNPSPRTAFPRLRPPHRTPWGPDRHPWTRRRRPRPRESGRASRRAPRLPPPLRRGRR